MNVIGPWGELCGDELVLITFSLYGLEGCPPSGILRDILGDMCPEGTIGPPGYPEGVVLGPPDCMVGARNSDTGC